MNLIFMGTPDFAVPSLKVLTESNHTVTAVVTGTDKEKGRGQKLAYTPVKEFALQKNIKIIQPESLKDPNFISELKALKPDLIVVVAFRILPAGVFSIPLHGSFNVHASLLPKYRGAAPIQRALINGDNKTGVTSFKLEEKVDTGNIYLMKECVIEDSDDFGSLHTKLSMLGAECVLETVNLIETGSFVLQKQNDALATPAPKITKEMGEINWNKPAGVIRNLVRAFSPVPGAYFYFKDKKIKIYKVQLTNKTMATGEIRSIDGELYIGCADNALRIMELQVEGKKRLDTASFLRGFTFSS